MNIRECIPEDKHDIAAIDRARLVGFPLLNQILPELLVWLRDSNWPVAVETASLLSEANVEITPHIKVVLDSEDGIWKYWTLKLVVSNLSFDVLGELRGELVRLANYPTQNDRLEEVDIVALEIVAAGFSAN